MLEVNLFLLKKFRREIAITFAVVLTLVAVVIVTAPKEKTGSASKENTVGDVIGLGDRSFVSSGSLTDTQILAYQDKLKKSGDKLTDSQNYSKLGLAYLQKAREVGDPSYYSKAEGVLNKAIELDPQNVEAMGGLGSLALSRHQFEQGLEWGQKAQQLRPSTAYYYGVMGDALVELGRYDDAAQVVQQMIDIRPDISSYSRVSYLRELKGQSEGAIEAMQKAVVASGPTLENKAWVTYQLGMLYFNRNDLEKAESNFRQTLQMLPDYVYGQAGLARIIAAKGDLAGAINLMLPVTKRMPLSELLIELGDLYTLNGQKDEANRQYELVRGISRIYKENGVDTDLEMALFDADHDNNLPEALSQAKKTFSQRPSIKAADVLGWTLYKTGDYQGAMEASKQALRLGTQDGLMLYHAGAIAAKLGQKDEARIYLQKSLSLNPNFSLLHAGEAKKLLAELGGAQ
jgi:tetratricopeptide (TPR) repeat protein